MSRCGCGDSCSCVLLSSDSVTVLGVGTPDNPYQMSVNDSTGAGFAPPPGTPDDYFPVVLGSGFQWLSPSQIKTLIGADGGGGSGLGGIYPVSNYGAHADNGVTDNTVPFNLAAAAAQATGGVVYYDELGTYGIQGAVNNGNVALLGQGGNQSPATIIRCFSSVASFSFGNPLSGDHFHPTWMTGIVIDYNGTGDVTGRFRHTAVKARLSSVHCTDLSVTGTNTAAMTPGIGAWINGSQNCTFQDFDCDATQGAALLLDNGAGGNNFERCEISTAGVLLRITDQSSGVNNGGGYPFGPANNYFNECIFESRLSDSSTLVSVECGAGNIFNDCGFSVSTTTGVVTSGALVKVTNDIVFAPFAAPFATHVGFTNCNWNGGTAGAVSGSSPCKFVQVDGPNLVSIDGIHDVQDYAYWVYNNSGASAVRFMPTDIIKGSGTGALFGSNATACNEKQSIIFGAGTTSTTLTWGGQTTAAILATDTFTTVQTRLQALSSIGSGNVKVTGPVNGGGPLMVEFIGTLAAAGRALITATGTGGTPTITRIVAGGTVPSLNTWANVSYMQMLMKLSAAFPIGLAVGHDDENFARIWIQRSGGVAFGDGTANPSVGLNFDATNQATNTAGQFRIGSGRSEALHAQAVATAAFTYSVDTTTVPGVIFSYVNNSCSLGTFTLTNPVDNQFFSITHIQPTPGGVPPVYPANVAWIGSVPTLLADGSVMTVTFRYQVSDSTWHEYSRSGNRQADLPTYAE